MRSEVDGSCSAKRAYESWAPRKVRVPVALLVAAVMTACAQLGEQGSLNMSLTLSTEGGQSAHGLPGSRTRGVMAARSDEAAVCQAGVPGLCVQPAQGCPAGRPLGVQRQRAAQRILPDAVR